MSEEDDNNYLDSRSAQVAFRGFLAGTLVCFMTASIAGLLIDSNVLETRHVLNGTIVP